MKKLLATVTVLGAVIVGSVAMAGPAAAKNQCGAVGFGRTGISTARLVHTCDAKTQVTYTVKCLIPGFNQQLTRYFTSAQSLVIDVRCPNGNPILSASYRLG
ncbi:hypothetical protein [Curtobacterium aurantiacum]|jgi:hypothetical protein|uniref:Secreted protein n=1 Tax=Curtobacterium aurantiacum TaxID=3236919 RepID=A0ABS5VCW5_9MICO|nr:hypothetical protein [Curtobacterium flaccumfaciens]MBT1544161.1 hypothetical protein [Curtobacterium flaccumfaciens pv. flaccumfaciens]MBT1586794.1 hypothetical protein [Curtobacterium flaccumfaciens pv. flaccumfaciens]